MGKLQEDRSKTVIAKAISEATKAVVKASTEAQSCSAGVREGSDGKLSSRLSKFEKSSEAKKKVVEDVKTKKPATRDKQKRSSRDKERRENIRKLKSKLNDELSIVSTATEVQGQEMMIMKHVNPTVQGDRAV